MISKPKRLVFLAILTGLSLLTYFQLSDSAIQPATAIAHQPTQGRQLEEEMAKGYHRSGNEIPMYVVVDHFFDVASLCRQAGPKNWNRMLNRLTVSPSSQAAKALDRATSEARTIMDATTDLTPYQDNPEAFVKVQHQAIRRKVHALSRVFYRMCDEMEQDGVFLTPLEEFLEQKIRPTISMVSFPTPDYEIFEIMEEFENRGRR